MGAFFGYDQHELVNRRWFYARRVGPYLAFHQGGNTADWLAQLDASASRPVIPAVNKLLDRVPPDANYVAIQRSLQQLPRFVDWLASLEDRVHADLAAYLAQARQKADGRHDARRAQGPARGPAHARASLLAQPRA
ncbi:MAG: hypothetical protein M5U12_30355 [Verrucomicrobia bacterium]|nr:hypothetical protein [Verrucomicrobiota bacterium]